MASRVPSHLEEKERKKFFFFSFLVFGGVWSLNCRVIMKENTKKSMNVFFFPYSSESFFCLIA